MADHMLQMRAVQEARARSLVIPREHGAWGMLLVPLVTGGVLGLLSGGTALPLVLFTIAALSLFWLRTPVESWLGTTPLRVSSPAEHTVVVQAIMILSAVTASAVTVLLWGGRNSYLLVLGVAAGLMFAAQAALKKFGRKMRMPAQILGAIGLTATAPAAYYVVTGRLDATAWLLWIANWLFAGDQIHFVQIRIHGARASTGVEKFVRGKNFLAGQLVLCGILFAAWQTGLTPALALLAFVPVLLRGTAWFFSKPQPLYVRHLGWTELGHALTFALLLVLGLSIHF
jgi:hypothetical protein